VLTASVVSVAIRMKTAERKAQERQALVTVADGSAVKNLEGVNHKRVTGTAKYNGLAWCKKR